MTADLIAALRAAIDADEATALAATQGEWVWSREFVTPPGYHHRTVGPLEPGDAAHITRFTPAFVLADIAAKRKLLDTFEQRYEASKPGKGEGMHWIALQEVVRALAEVYALRTEGPAA